MLEPCATPGNFVEFDGVGEPDSAGDGGVAGDVEMTLQGWESLYEKVAAVIGAARSRVRSTVNQAMVLTYWQVGQLIVEDEQAGEVRAEYGKAVLEGLAARLTGEFGKGFDARNLRNMRQFYLTFPIWNALRTELSWTHYRLLLKVESEAARLWYITEAIAKYSVLAGSEQIFASRYRLVLPTEEELVAGLRRLEEDVGDG
jgi:hypothetical protein